MEADEGNRGFGDHYALFDLPRSFALDADLLELRYRALQSRVHPDRYAHLPEAERRMSMQWATRANEAYQTLKQPLARARYLLALADHDPQVEQNTAMPMEFLVEQMEWREAVAEARAARDIAALEKLHASLRRRMKDEYILLAERFDGVADLAAAAALVRQLMFLEKLQHDIEEALEAVDA